MSAPNGFYEARVSLTAGQTTALPFTIWSPLIDTAHQVTIPSPTTAETVVATPVIPGLELHLPAGTIIRDEDGEIVRTLTITPVPLDRTPFPLPPEATFTMYFTIQPGGAYVHTPGPIRGAWLVYPNLRHSRTGKRVQFFNYDPDDKGWYVYGMGTVTPTQVTPDPKVRLYAFTGASFNDGNTPPDAGPKPGDCCSNDGDPVNLATGIFTYSMTDLVVPDVIPLAVTRTYNSRDPEPRPFGTGMTHAYTIFQFSELYWEEADLILPDGGKIHYVRISQQGLPWYQTVFEHTASPTAFYKSRIAWNGNGWDLTLKDGTVYVFGHQAPLQAMRDRHGNTVRFTWSETNLFGVGTGDLLRVTSPNGRWIDFTYEPGTTRVSQVQDNLGRTVSYGYDANGNLTSVTDREQRVTSYTYDGGNRLVTVKTRNQQGTAEVLVTNTYDTTPASPTLGWVTRQTHADGGVFAFAYSVTNGLSTQTDVTDPLGHVRRVTFNADGYSLTNTRAYGTADAQTTSSGRQTGSQFVETSTDPHGLQTATTYDALGNVATVTRLAGTPNAVTTSYTYEPKFQQVATITDPLQHTTTFEYDTAGNLTRVVDPLQHATTFTYNPQGLTTAVTDALQHTTSLGYTGGDLTTVADPLGRVTTRLLDGLGRVRTVINPLGQTTRYTYDGNSHVTTVTDALGGQTGLGYFPDGQLEHVTDANQHTTAYTYDPMGRLATRTDPLGRIEYFGYDLEGRPLQGVDRKGQVTLRGYDGLDRLRTVTYNDGSTITYTYDDRDRMTQIADTAAGTIGRGYDDLDRLTTETTLQGTVSYTYDAADRRATMTVAGQPDVVYTYDDADRLTGLSRDTLSVALAYDEANRRTSLTLPNGIVTEYAYDDANELTSLTYLNGPTTLGDLTYTYDLAGQRVAIGGSWARTLLPQPVAGASYDAANELTAWGGQEMAYDPNGNLTFDGTLVYGWNARNQLASLAGGTGAAFQYDATSRRTAKTIDGTTTAFLYDGLDALKTDVGGSVNVRLLGTAIDEWFASVGAGGVSVPLVDALGSTHALAAASGAVYAHYTYDPFGVTAPSGLTSSNASQFTGRENDGAGLYHYRARYYDPKASRFMSEDPIGLAAGTSNYYVYVDDRPTLIVDPLGLQGGVGGVMRIIHFCDFHKYRNVFNRCPQKEPKNDPHWEKDWWGSGKYRWKGGGGSDGGGGNGGSECAYDCKGNLLPDENGSYT